MSKSHLITIYDEGRGEINLICLQCGATSTKSASLIDGDDDDVIALSLDHLPDCPMILIRLQQRGN